MGMGGQRQARVAVPRERDVTQCIGGRMGTVRKMSPPTGFNTRTVQPVASRYKDCAIRLVLRPTLIIHFMLLNRAL
jgi:hypothetical protein